MIIKHYKGKSWYEKSDFIWVYFLRTVFAIPLVTVPPVGCESLAKLCWLLERLCAACTPVEGMNRGKGREGELHNSRLTGATDKTEAMLDQQPKTNQVKQQPQRCSGCWVTWATGSQKLSGRLRETHTLEFYPGVSGDSWLEMCLQSQPCSLNGTEIERNSRRNDWESVCLRDEERMKERASWGFNPLFFSDCYTSDRYCAKHSCLWGWCQLHVLQLLLISPGFIQFNTFTPLTLHSS